MVWFTLAKFNCGTAVPDVCRCCSDPCSDPCTCVSSSLAPCDCDTLAAASTGPPASAATCPAPPVDTPPVPATAALLLVLGTAPSQLDLLMTSTPPPPLLTPASVPARESRSAFRGETKGTWPVEYRGESALGDCLGVCTSGPLPCCPSSGIGAEAASGACAAGSWPSALEPQLGQDTTRSNRCCLRGDGDRKQVGLHIRENHTRPDQQDPRVVDIWMMQSMVRRSSMCII